MAVIELAETIPEHILSDGKPLCDANCADANGRVLPDSRDPRADASLYLCQACVRHWERIVDEVDRTPTVRCAVDRTEDGALFTCCDVVVADEARRLEHPHADQPVPVCPECYEWLLDYPSNGVTTAYEDARAWADTHIS